MIRGGGEAGANLKMYLCYCNSPLLSIAKRLSERRPPAVDGLPDVLAQRNVPV